MEIEKQDNCVFFSKNNFETRPMQIQSNAGFARGMSLLRTGIYSDKIGAVVREYICNAIDEHNKYCPNEPVEITIDDTGFRVRDYGLGLDKESVFNVFGALFESRKTKNDIGGFGLGSKSGHAYNDIFYITSYYQGEQFTYSFIISVNEEGLEEANSYLMSHSSTEKKSGIEVWVPFTESYHKTLFKEKVTKFAKYADFPIMLNGIPCPQEKPIIVLKDKFRIYPQTDPNNYGAKTIVKMGPVLYNADFINNGRFLNSKFDCVIDVPINEYPIPPSREMIVQNTSTLQKAKEIEKEFQGAIHEFINSKDFKPSPIDIFNLAHSRTSQIQFDFAWMASQILIDFLKSQYKDAISKIEKLGFYSKDNTLFLFDGDRLKNPSKMKYESGRTIYSDGKIIILDNIVFGEFRHSQIVEHLEKTALPKKCYFLKNSLFPLKDVPEEVREMFIDLRGFVFKKPIREKTVRDKAESNPRDYTTIKASLYLEGDTYCRDYQLTIAGWKEKLAVDIKEKNVIIWDGRSCDNYSDLVRVRFHTKKAKKLFEEELDIPTYKVWVERNRQRIINFYKKHREYKELQKNLTGRAFQIVSQKMKNPEIFCEYHYGNLTEEEKKVTVDLQKYKKLIDWTKDLTNPWAVISKICTQSYVDELTFIKIKSQLDEQIKNLLEAE